MELTFDVRATDNSAQTIETTIPGTTTPVSYNTGVSVIPGVSYKYSYRSADDPQKIHWVAIVNASQEPIHHLVIEDTLSEGQYFTDEDKANVRVLRKVVVADDPIDSEREISERLTVDNHRRDVVFSETGFTYTAPDEYIQTLDGKDYGHPYYILYTTHIKDEAYATGNVLNNTITVKGSNGYNNPYTARYVVDSGTGRASAVKSDKVILETQKLVEGAGASLKADQFEFAIYAADDLAKPLQVKKNDADGKASGEVVTLSEDNNWTYTWSDLDQKANKQDIVYAVEEAEVEGYKSKVSAIKDGQIVVTNTYNPETTAVEVSKTWDDAENQDGKRPASLEVALVKDGQITDQKLVLTAANNWSASFNNLPKFANGVEIAYSVAEVTVPEGYTASEPVLTEEGSWSLTNTYSPEVTNITGQKTWDDADNQDGKRPESITVNLLADGQEVAEKTVTAEDDWKYSFEGLPKFKNGQEIVYTITEDAVANYAVTQDGYNLTNSYTPGKTSVTVSKVWDDENDQDGLRPDSIEVQLYANGEKSGDVVVLSKDNNWTYIWNELDLKADKKEIV
ncbi:Cna B-type domain-containing protein, partial [Streptococcus pluranimalium]|uniref:Cna B-type domain-containing protein n=1 Tax=Streptococcus pluranimalium TaxID=82348 RepID=UPI003BF8FDE4